jgi:hypothetical protein
VNREALEHLLRAAAAVTGERMWVVKKIMRGITGTLPGEAHA